MFCCSRGGKKGGGGGGGAGGSASSIARGAADQAHGAIEKQDLAALQAAYQAKSALAAQAKGAAETARAALAGKQAVVSALGQVSDILDMFLLSL